MEMQRPFANDAECHECAHCGLVILARETYLILEDGLFHEDCIIQILEQLK